MDFIAYGQPALGFQFHGRKYYSTSTRSMDSHVISHMINLINGLKHASYKAYPKADFYSAWRILRLLPCLLGLGLILGLGLVLVPALVLVLVLILVLVGLHLRPNG